MSTTTDTMQGTLTLDELKAARSGELVQMTEEWGSERYTKNTDSDKGAARWTNAEGKWLTSAQLATRGARPVSTLSPEYLAELVGTVRAARKGRKGDTFTTLLGAAAIVESYAPNDTLRELANAGLDVATFRGFEALAERFRPFAQTREEKRSTALMGVQLAPDTFAAAPAGAPVETTREERKANADRKRAAAKTMREARTARVADAERTEGTEPGEGTDGPQTAVQTRSRGFVCTFPECIHHNK